MDVIKQINELLTPEQKAKFKEFAAKFNVTPIVQGPPAQAPAPTPAPTPVQFGEGLLNDGVTVVKYNTPTLSEGSVITVVTPEGEVPAPEGEHTLQDGTVITVASENGQAVVKSVKKVEAPEMAAQVAQVQQAVASFSDKFSAFIAEKEEFTKKVSEQDSKITELETKLTQSNEQVKAFIQLFSEILETPSGNPTVTPPNKFVTKTKKLFSLAD